MGGIKISQVVARATGYRLMETALLDPMARPVRCRKGKRSSRDVTLMRIESRLYLQAVTPSTIVKGK